MNSIFTKWKNFSAEQYACLLFGAVAIVVCLFVFSGGISGNDFWWHVKAGEWICTHRSVPKTDIFSWYGKQNAFSWTAQEWLSEVIFYKLYSFGGSRLVFIFCLLLAYGMLALFFKRVCCIAKKNVLIFGLFSILFAMIMIQFFYGRPHIFGFFLFFFELEILYDFQENEERKSLWAIPVIACLWSNLHGGSSCLSYGLLGLVLLCGLINYKGNRIEAKRFSKKKLVRLLTVTVLTIAAIFVNPIGGRVFLYPYEAWGDSFTLSVISEFSAPDAKDISQLLFYYFPIFIMTIGFFLAEKKIRLYDAAVGLCFLFLFFRSVRFIMLWYIAAMFYAWPYIPDIKVKPLKKWWERVVVALAGVGVVIFAGFGIVKLAGTLAQGDVITKEADEGLISCIKKENPKRLFNDYNLGGDLVFHDIEVFIAGMADNYGREYILQDAMSIDCLISLNQEEDFYVDIEQMFEKYSFDGVAILKERPLYAYLKSHPEKYEEVYLGERCAYFKILKP